MNKINVSGQSLANLAARHAALTAKKSDNKTPVRRPSTRPQSDRVKAFVADAQK